MCRAKLVCSHCGMEVNWGNQYRCPQCADSLEVSYDYAWVDADVFKEAVADASGLWAFRHILPVRDKSDEISLGEGNTPLVRSVRMGEKLQIGLYFKDETRNPTGAFKDRPNTVGISMARSLGLSTVTIASTGNGAASLSAYAAKAGMPCYVFVPQATPAPKIAQASIYGAQIVRVLGDYSSAYKLAFLAAETFHWGNLTSTYLNPYTMEGDKTIAYEIFRQLGYRVPDWIVVPLGAGAMLTGIYKGFEELKLFGMADTLPRMIGVQAAGCAPITTAFERGQSAVEEWHGPKTVAGGICDPLTGYEKDGTRTLNNIRRSNGYGVTVSDEEILFCMQRIAQQEAIFCEPASAAAQAAVEKLVKKGVIQPGDTVVDIITGHGLKDVEAVKTPRGTEDAVEPNLQALCKKYNIK